MFLFFDEKDEHIMMEIFRERFLSLIDEDGIYTHAPTHTHTPPPPFGVGKKSKGVNQSLKPPSLSLAAEGFV